MKLQKNNGTRGVSYGIIGLGRFGTALAIELAGRGREVLVVDADEERVRCLRDYTENAFVVHSLDRNTLMETGIQNCDVAVVCICEKMDVSILTTLHLKSMGIARVVAKAASAEHGEILEKLGAEVVYPERDMAVRLARRLEPSKILNYLELSEKIDISKAMVPGSFVGKRVVDVDVRRRYGLNIIAIEHRGEIFTDITPDYVFRDGDQIFVIGDRTRISALERELP